MTGEIQALSEFLQHQPIRYCNPACVILHRIVDGSLYVVAGYPGVEQTADISLEFFEHFDHVTRFMALLHFTDLKQLAGLAPEDLLPLYEGELLSIVCTLKGTKVREMSFRKMGGMVWAINSRKKMHLVRKPIHQPGDFIDYTKRYYKVSDN